MKFREVTSFLLIFILVCCLSTVQGLKCKCTQSSWKTTCEKGICEVPDGSSACLMLDHPVSGRHYACSQSPARQPDCIEKITKSGATVTVCSCDSSDFCNFQLWPSDTPEVTSASSSTVRDGRRELQIVNSTPGTRWGALIGFVLLNFIRL